MLAGKEFEHATVENTIESFKEAIICAQEYNGQIREVNTDRGTQFFNIHGSKSKFQSFLEENGIRYIPSRRNNPQPNGKIERFWLEYERHLWRFGSSEDFIQWYK